MNLAPEAHKLGTDKLGYHWSVELSVDPPTKTASHTQVFFKIFLPVENCKYSNNSPGGGFFSIHDPTEPTAMIEDIKINPAFENRGIGSLLLKFMEFTAREMRIVRMTGELSQADAGHFTKLKHFYEKHGFRVCLDKNPDPRFTTIIGKIEKWLS